MFKSVLENVNILSIGNSMYLLLTSIRNVFMNLQSLSKSFPSLASENIRKPSPGNEKVKPLLLTCTSTKQLRSCVPRIN